MEVYLDHGATTPVDPKVLEAMLPYFTDKFGNPSSLHSKGREAAFAIENSRNVLADRLNCSVEEIIFTSGGSEADNLAVKGVAYGGKKKGKNHVITSTIEHPAVAESCASLEKQGFKVTYLPVDKEGFVDLEEFERALTEKTSIVSIIHGNNEIGTIQDIGEIGRICSESGVFLHTDAVQSFTKVPFDVKKFNIALASFSAHKIHGPKGVGALYARSDVQRILEKQVDGGHHEHDLRAGTENVVGIVGFAKAVELAEEGHAEKMSELRDKLIEGLLGIEETHLNGPTGANRLPNNASISFHSVEGEGILLYLDGKGISVSTGSACSSKSLKPSSVLTAIGLAPEVAHGTIRFTLGRNTTQKEIDYTIKSTREVVGKLRSMSPIWKK
ncbi:MAG: cysteine desulfurase family protein [Methanobacteriota archaeon]